jgi:hypothetical protein
MHIKQDMIQSCIAYVRLNHLSCSVIAGIPVREVETFVEKPVEKIVEKIGAYLIATTTDCNNNNI